MIVIDCHFHLWTTDSGTAAKRAERADQIRTEAAALGVDKVCLIGPYARDPDYPNEHGAETAPAGESNETVRQYVDEHPDLCYGWAQIDPRSEDGAVAEFRRAVTADGLIGLKHHFLGSPVKLSDPLFDPIAEAAVELDVPILEHVLHRLDPYPDEYPAESYTEDVVDLASRFPKLTLISAHIAGGGDWEYRIKNVRDYENVYLDISGSVRDAGIIEMAAAELGADRLVFGTDTWFVPGVGKLLGCELSPEEKATIAYRIEDLIRDDVPNAYDDEELAARRERARDRFAKAVAPIAEPLICANGFVGNHPHRDHDATPEDLLAVMDATGVDRTIVSATEATLYRNVQAANERLHEAVAGHRDRLVPVATINPTYPAWEADLARCIDEFGMRGVKLLPAYHDYDIDRPEVRTLFEWCAERGVPVIVTAVLEDQRQRHPRVTLRGFDGKRTKWWNDDQVDDLIAVLRACPETDVIIADAWTHAERIADAVTTVTRRGVRLDNQIREGETLFVLGDLNMYFTYLGENIVDRIGAEHLVYGPKLPFKIADAYYIYIEHLPVEEGVKDAIRHERLRELFSDT